jgi:hypothetical protein
VAVLPTKPSLIIFPTAHPLPRRPTVDDGKDDDDDDSDDDDDDDNDDDDDDDDPCVGKGNTNNGEHFVYFGKGKGGKGYRKLSEVLWYGLDQGGGSKSKSKSGKGKGKGGSHRGVPVVLVGGERGEECDNDDDDDDTDHAPKQGHYYSLPVAPPLSSFYEGAKPAPTMPTYY